MTGLMVSMLAFVAGVKDKLASEKGATATEYSLLVAFIAFAGHRRRHLFGTRSARGSPISAARSTAGSGLAKSLGRQVPAGLSNTGVPRPCIADAAHFFPSSAAYIPGGIQ